VAPHLILREVVDHDLVVDFVVKLKFFLQIFANFRLFSIIVGSTESKHISQTTIYVITFLRMLLEELLLHLAHFNDLVAHHGVEFLILVIRTQCLLSHLDQAISLLYLIASISLSDDLCTLGDVGLLQS